MNTTTCPRCASDDLASNGRGFSVTYWICRKCLAAWGVENGEAGTVAGQIHAEMVLTATSAMLAEAEQAFSLRNRAPDALPSFDDFNVRRHGQGGQ